MYISGMAGFSRRELRVIALLATGAKTLEIAVELNVKPVAVYNYVKLIYRKTGLYKRRALIAWAKDNGLDDPSLIAPAALNAARSRNRKMRGFFGLATKPLQ
jgi:DNA-binding CsgD family transcriptional regulator